MRKIQNTNLSIRLTSDLKKRLIEFSLQHDLHSSFVIRQALALYLKGQTETELPRLMVGSAEVERRPSAWLGAGK